MRIPPTLCMVAALVTALAACSGAQKASSETGEESSTDGIAVPEGFPAGAKLDYQLGGAYEPVDGVDVVVRDVTDEPADGVYSVCYLNGFQTQPAESAPWLADGLVLLIDGVPLADPDWPDEFLLDTSTADHRASIAERIGEGLQQCADKGYDAVELDNLDSYTRSEGLLTLADNVALAAMLVQRGHDLGLLVGQKNAAEESGAFEDLGFDFAVAEQCVEFDECTDYTDTYGEAVLAIEYPRESGVEDPCSAPGRPESMVLRDRDLTMPGDPAYLYRAC
ncbi:endo alpha-1,4 polygalactosaminidase [Arthrobacter echini]|uniref:Endo alpha-1,4 polygalactosaminidase n=1 Tax=Arthrobacter echini TaxID=1529066 RepID=A0A5D0XQZ8_9MICC|nr:endo alpha-1,4 polygalactosaminidase [Arthrobacter echini]TYC98829.1 endo alpha-1,4 polygalactosaminidase [Arthrobacter echini]